MDAADIRDRDSLREWLIGQYEPSVTAMIAVRAATRVQPHLFLATRPLRQNAQLTSLPFLRAIISSFVAVTFPYDKDVAAAVVRSAASAFAAASTVRDVVSASSSASDAASIAVRVAGLATRDHDAASTFVTSTDAVDAAVSVVVHTEVHSLDPSSVWSNIREDCEAFRGDELGILQSRLWPTDRRFVEEWRRVRDVWIVAGAPWRFFANWYDEILEGDFSDWELLRSIALLSDETWNNVAALARAIHASQSGETPDPSNEALLTPLLMAALTDYRFSDLHNLFEMTPFGEDIKHLENEKLRDFLEDAEDAQEALVDLAKAIAAAGNARQGSGGIEIYANRAAKYLAKAEDRERMAIGPFLDACATLQSYALNEDARAEIGEVLSGALDRQVAALLQLSRTHFAPSLARMAPLRDFVISPDDDTSALVAKLTSALNSVRSADSGHAIPLDEEAQAVLDNMLDELRRLELAYSITKSPREKELRGEELARKSSGFVVTIVRLRVIANNAGKTVNKIVTFGGKTKKLMELIEWALEVLKTGGTP